MKNNNIMSYVSIEIKKWVRDKNNNDLFTYRPKSPYLMGGNGWNELN